KRTRSVLAAPTFFSIARKSFSASSSWAAAGHAASAGSARVSNQRIGHLSFRGLADRSGRRSGRKAPPLPEQATAVPTPRRAARAGKDERGGVGQNEKRIHQPSA